MAATAKPANYQQHLAQARPANLDQTLDQTLDQVSLGPRLSHSNLAQANLGQVQQPWASWCLAQLTPASPQGARVLAVGVRSCMHLCAARMLGGTQMPALHSVRVLRCQLYVLMCTATA
jgi:hypothetical protein